jgi:hypothetical protein
VGVGPGYCGTLLVMGLLGLGSCLPDESREAENDESALALEEAVRLPPLDRVQGVRDVATTDSGNVWILTTGEPVLVLQSSSGAIGAEFGRLGRGPNEFGFPSAILHGTDTTLTVLDRERRQLRTFSDDGRELVSTPIDDLQTMVPSDLDESLAGSPFRASSRGGGLVTADYPETRAPGTAHLWNRRIVRIDLETGRLDELVDFRSRRDELEDRLGGAAVLAPAPLWAECPDGAVARYVPFDDELTWDGPNQATVEVPESVRPLRENEVRTTVLGRLSRVPGTADRSQEELEQMLPMVLEQLRDEISEHAPAYAEMLCDSQGRVWLQHFSTEHDWTGRGASADVLDRDGLVARGVALPPGFRPVRFDGQGLLGVERNELDLESVMVLVVR